MEYIPRKMVLNVKRGGTARHWLSGTLSVRKMSRGLMGQTPCTYGTPLSVGMSDAIRSVASAQKEQERINTGNQSHSSPNPHYQDSVENTRFVAQQERESKEKHEAFMRDMDRQQQSRMIQQEQAKKIEAKAEEQRFRSVIMPSQAPVSSFVSGPTLALKIPHFDPIVQPPSTCNLYYSPPNSGFPFPIKDSHDPSPGPAMILPQYNRG